MTRAKAVAEVALVIAVAWAAYKAFKYAGLDAFGAAPGAIMAAVALAMICLHRWRASASGFVANDWRRDMTVGAVFSAAVLASGLLEIAFLSSGSEGPANIGVERAATVAAVRIPCVVIALLLVARLSRDVFARCSVWLPSLVGVLLLCVVPIALAIHRGADAWQVWGFAGSLILATAIGEELLFRGYAQSTLNVAFGKPWRFLGVEFGPGMIIAALLFGAIHVLNPAKPFAGEWQVSWLWGAATVLSGLVFGYLRELTGCIWAAAIVHALTGLYRGM